MNLRKEARKANLAKWTAQGPAVIQRPLQLIQRRTSIAVSNRDGTVSYKESPIGCSARIAAAHGDGLRVKALARSVL